MGIREGILTWVNHLNEKYGILTEDDLDYIDVPVCKNNDEEELVQETLIKHGALPLHELRVGETYIGTCRNASEAVWNGKKFIYQRYKWGSIYDEEINHFQNDDGYDVFVPVRLKTN